MDSNREFGFLTDQAIFARRHFLSQVLREKTGSVIQHGILAGYELGDVDWARAAVGSYLLGTYEVQVCALLDRLKSPSRLLVDIGAADGVYGLGLVAVGAFGRSVCFEMDRARQTALCDSRRKLGLESKVDLRGEANADEVLQAVRDSTDRGAESVVLCDIEGAEFDLFDEDLLAGLAGHHVIIELHPFLHRDGDEAAARLVRAAKKYFNVVEIRDGLRLLDGIELLEGWKDSDVWLTCVEGRHEMMTWLYLSPQSSPILAQSEIDSMVLGYQRRHFRHRGADE